MDIYEKLNIPKKAGISNTIYKKKFYENADLTTADKELFKNNIAKITWKYCLKPENTHIKPYKDSVREYSELEILEVSLENDAKLKRIAEIVMKTIPYPMILIFTYENKCQLWLAHQRINQNDISKNVLEDFVNTNWLEQQDKLFNKLDFNKLNLVDFHTMYCDIMDIISVDNLQKTTNQTQNAITGEEARKQLEEIERLENEIAGLKNKLRKETQFNKRVEIGLEIKKLEGKI